MSVPKYNPLNSYLRHLIVYENVNLLVAQGEKSVDQQCH